MTEEMLPYQDELGIDLAKMPTAELRKELADALRLTGWHLRYLADIWKELEGRGEDLSALKAGMGVYLSKIAAGTLVAEIVVMYAGEPMLLRKASSLPVADQKAIAGGAVPPWAKKAIPMRSQGTRQFAPPQPKDRGECGAEPPVAMAAKAGPKDLTEIIIKMVDACGDPKEAARRLIPELERVLARREKLK